MAFSPRWWITIYVGSRKGVKKKKPGDLYIFKKKKKVSRFSNKFIDHFDLSLDENFFETIRVKRDEGER